MESTNNQTSPAKIHEEIKKGYELGRSAPSRPPDAGARRPPAPGGSKIPETVRSLRNGKLHLGLDPRDPHIQKLACLFWARESPTLWMLALHLADGRDFPFAEAMQAHLASAEGATSQLLLLSPIVKSLAAAVRLRRNLEGLRARALAWEESTRWALLPLPSAAQFGADEEGLPPQLPSRAQFDDGTEVELIPYTGLALAVSQPAASAPAHGLTVQLIGETGASLDLPVALQEGEHYRAARHELGSLAEQTDRLGKQCLVVVSKEPPPRWGELAQTESANDPAPETDHGNPLPD